MRAQALLLAVVPFAQEADFYAVDYLPEPEGERLEVGGMDFLPDGRLVVSTRRGQVWIVEGALADDPETARFHLFAEGLQEGLGLNVVDGEIFVIQRGEVSRLRDTDGDGTCDHVDTIANGWGLSGNYHEFAFGLPRDESGNFYVGLNVAFFNPEWWHGKSAVPWRGWVVRVKPDGSVEPWAYGFRSPCGLGQNSVGDVFVTDNQGDWCASSPIYHLVKDGFYGHPASLNWTDEYVATQTKSSDTIPPAAALDRRPAAIWLPYKWSRSTGNVVSDPTGGGFGPFADQLFVAELTNGMVLRADLEKVRGEYQGACFLFRQSIGSVARVAFAPDGTLFCGLTNRGWGGRSPADGIARVRWTGETPMEMRSVHLLQDGFEIDFTLPIEAGLELSPADVDVLQYDYDYWWEYGSPEKRSERIGVESTRISDDRRKLFVRTAGLTPARVARVVVSGVRGKGGVPLLHDEFNYTINQLPEGPATTEHVSKVAPPPPPKESTEEGWLRLTWGDATDLWNSKGWELVDADLDPDDPKAIETQPGVGALVNTGREPSHYVSETEFGDQEIHVEFMLPEGGNSGVYVMGRYEVQLLDSTGQREPGFGDCGGIYRGESWPGSPPAFNAFKGAGVWHDLDIAFRAPRFDRDGVKVRNARFERVLLDGTVLHENVEIPQPTIAALFGDEAPLGPLMLQGDHGPVAFGNIRVKPLARRRGGNGWVDLVTDETWDAWKALDEADWEWDGEIVRGSGPRGHLFSPRDDYVNFEVRAKVKINEGGNSGLYFRARDNGAWPAGYEAQINSSFPDVQKTGSLYGLVPVKTHLIPANTWFDYRVTCRDIEEGTRIVIRVNGAVIVDHVDTARTHASGCIALQQHHEGSVIEVKGLQIRELE